MRHLVKGESVLIVGHADGDGHLAAEQSRRNALHVGARSCTLLVDPRITSSYRFWDRHLKELDLGAFGAVFFVDLRLDPKRVSETFSKLVDRALEEPNRLFVLIDHHPYGGLPAAPSNLQVWFTPAVYTCCYGPPSGLMIVASICDRDEAPVASMITEQHRRRAKGVSRAAADRGGLSGPRLLKLLASDRWDILEALGNENPQFHRTVRGWRPTSWQPTTAIEAARTAAE